VAGVFLLAYGPRLLGQATDLIFDAFLVQRPVDFAAVRNTLLGVVGVYVSGSVLVWIQGYLLNDVVQNTIRRMRADVEDKVNSLPLEYFDKQPRGELMSRVTNDIDNVSQSLQQTMSQLLNSLLTVVAVLAMMLWISPLLALIAVVSVPLSMFVTARIM
jgi:ATP-binding cassette subfamily B protein